MDKKEFSTPMNINTRLLLVGLLPKTGSLKEVRLALKFQKRLVLDKEEVKTVNLRNNGRTTTWDSSKDPNKPFEFTMEDITFFKDMLDLADQKEEFPADEKLIEFYEKLVEYTKEEKKDNSEDKPSDSKKKRK